MKETSEEEILSSSLKRGTSHTVKPVDKIHIVDKILGAISLVGLIIIGYCIWKLYNL